MSQWEKLLEKIKCLDNNMRFSELEKVLKYYGYKKGCPRSGSSHFTFRKPGCNPITIPSHKPIKTVYVKMIKNIVESEDSNQKQKED